MLAKAIGKGEAGMIEYKVVKLFTSNSEGMKERLDLLGKEGWDLVTVVDYNWVFKRAIGPHTSAIRGPIPVPSKKSIDNL